MSQEFDDTIVGPARTLSGSHDLDRSQLDDTDDTVIPSAGYDIPLDSEGLAEGWQTWVQTTEPVAFAYRIQIGENEQPIGLDVPIFIGRAPIPPRISRGPAPKMIRVLSPLKQVSATHVEVRQLGPSVIVTDLASTNGTTVMAPGSVPRRLRQGESVVVAPGTLIDLGEGNLIHVLSSRAAQADQATAEVLL